MQTAFIGIGLEIMRSRPFGSGTLFRILSCTFSGSPGTNICVTSRLMKPSPKIDRWICGGLHQRSG